MKNALIVNFKIALGQTIRMLLKAHGYDVELMFDFETASTLLRRGSYDLIIWGDLPDHLQMVQLIQTAKACSAAPVMVTVTRDGGLADKYMAAGCIHQVMPEELANLLSTLEAQHVPAA